MKTGNRVKCVEGTRNEFKTGTLLGCSSKNALGNFWILQLDEPIFFKNEEWRAIIVSEFEIKKIEF